MLLAVAGLCQNAGSVITNTVSPDFFVMQKDQAYGLGDRTNWYPGTPTGDSIFHAGDHYFAVRNLNHYVLYDEQFKPAAARIKQVIVFYKSLLLLDSAGWYVLPGETNLRYDSIYVSGNYTWLYKNGRQGLLSSQQELISPDYDHLGPWHEGILLMKGAKLGWRGGGIDIPLEYDHIFKERPDIMAAKNKSGTVYYSLENKTKLNTEPGDSVVFYDDGYYKCVRGKRESIFDLATHQLLEESESFAIHPFEFDDYGHKYTYSIAAKDSSCALYRQGKLLTGFDYDNVLHANFADADHFRVMVNNRMGLIDNQGRYDLHPLYTDIVGKMNDYYIVRKGNAAGLSFKNDSVIIPAKYRVVYFYDDRYAYISADAKHYGLVNYITGKEVAPCLFTRFEIDSNFIIAHAERMNYVYYKDQVKGQNVFDAMCNGTTVKWYQDGKIVIAYTNKDSWEEYSYEIPTYQVNEIKPETEKMPDFYYTGSVDMYDYSVGKWGYYDYPTQTWSEAPLIHSGDIVNGERIMRFASRGTMTWMNIRFTMTGSLSPMRKAWNDKSRYAFMDVNGYNYPSGGTPERQLVISPICYSAPGKGVPDAHYSGKNINAVFAGTGNKSILVENGMPIIGEQGEQRLSDYICQMSTNGNNHPQSAEDYAAIISPHAFIRFEGASEHVLHKARQNGKFIPVLASYEWLDKKGQTPLAYRSGNFYGLLKETGETLLEPVYENLELLDPAHIRLVKAAVRPDEFSVYYPASRKFSRPVYHLAASKDDLLHIKDNKESSVLNLALDTLIKTPDAVTLLGGQHYSTGTDKQQKVYKGNTELFTCNGTLVEKIDEGHFLINLTQGSSVVNIKGDSLYTSRRHIRYLSLANNYLLDDADKMLLFSKDDHLLSHFEKTSYFLNRNKDLILKNEASVYVIARNSNLGKNYKGKLYKANEKYFVLNKGKSKSVYLFSGECLVKNAKAVKVLNEEYLSFQSGKNFYLFNTRSKEKTKIRSLSVNLKTEGIVYEEDDELVTADISVGDSLYICQEKGRMGIKQGEKIILASNYFEIIPLHEAYLVKDQIEYQLYNPSTGQFINQEHYKTVGMYKNYLVLNKEGKVSYLDVQRIDMLRK